MLTHVKDCCDELQRRSGSALPLLSTLPTLPHIGEPGGLARGMGPFARYVRPREDEKRKGEGGLTEKRQRSEREKRDGKGGDQQRKRQRKRTEQGRREMKPLMFCMKAARKASRRGFPPETYQKATEETYYWLPIRILSAFV